MYYPTASYHFQNRLFTITAAIIVAAAALFLPGNAHGQLDPTFGTNGVTTTDLGSNDTPIGTFVLPDGKILVVVRSEGTSSTYYFVRYNANGTPDAAYGTNGKVLLPLTFQSFNDHYLLRASRQSDGKIIVIGNDNQDGLIARFNEDGTLDSGFAAGGIHRPNMAIGRFDGITSVVVQPDNKIVVAGFAQTQPFSLVKRLYLIRYLSNGTLDPTVGNGDGFIVHQTFDVDDNGAPYLFLLSTGKFVAVTPSEPNGYPNGHARRFNADGTLDSSYLVTFNIVNSTFRTAYMQPDGKLLIGTSVSRTDTLFRSNIDSIVSRFNADASVDSSFGTTGSLTYDVGPFLDNYPTAIQTLSDGQIVVADSVDVKPNRSRYRGSTLALTRLSVSGTVNGKFLVTNSNDVSGVSALTVQPDGKILATSGLFNTTNSTNDVLLTRVTGVPLEAYKFRGVPFDFAPSAFDGKSDSSVFRPSDRRWYLNPVYPGYFFGLADDIPVPSDYIGNFAAEMAVFRPSNGHWFIATSYTNPGANYLEVPWGTTGDIPVPADFDGDGKSDIAVFRPSDGNWYIRNSTNGSATIVHWGANGDKPAAGDFDGDGKYDLAVFRPSDGNWYILRSSDGQFVITHFGLNGDIPVQEDYDGDGKTDIAVWRPSDSVWYRLNSSDGSFAAFNWGLSTDVPVPGDYDGDLKTDIAIFRPSNGRWYVYQSSNNQLAVFNWGTSGDVPLQGKN